MKMQYFVHIFCCWKTLLNMSGSGTGTGTKTYAGQVFEIKHMKKILPVNTINLCCYQKGNEHFSFHIVGNQYNAYTVYISCDYLLAVIPRPCFIFPINWADITSTAHVSKLQLSTKTNNKHRRQKMPWKTILELTRFHLNKFSTDWHELVFLNF